MAIVQKFEYIWPEGTIPVEMNDWLKTLSQSEQDEYWEGRRNGDRLRQIAIDAGRMIIAEDGSYIWKNQEEFNVNKQNDLVWQRYWQRWQDETGVKFRSIIEGGK